MTVLLLLTVFTVLGVSNLFAVSEAGVLFLMISPGARAAGMGNTFVAVADDATASYWNPAGLAFQSGKEITFMHAKWLPQLVDDMSYEFLAYKHEVPSLGGIVGGNITFLNLGEQVQTGPDSPDPIGTFMSWDMAVTLNYATKLSEGLGLGLGMRYIRSNLAPMGAGQEQGNGIANAFAVDIGVLYKTGFINGLTLGANLSNLGPAITYVDAAQADPLPTNLRLGLSYKILDSEFNKLLVAVDTNKLLVVRHKDEKPQPFYQAIFTSWTDEPLADQANKLISSIGVEYVYSDLIFLRTGYYYDYEGNVKYPTFGAGLKYSAFRFDFGYVAAEQGHPLSDTMRFSLTAAF